MLFPPADLQGLRAQSCGTAKHFNDLTKKPRLARRKAQLLVPNPVLMSDATLLVASGEGKAAVHLP